MFTYKKNQLWMVDQSHTKILANRSLTIDAIFFLQFKEKPDMRDSRPLNYNGRIVLGPTTPDEFVWKPCSLIQKGRTEPATMLHARDMVIVENIASDALPASTDGSASTVQGAKKFEQIGVDGSLKIMDSVLDGVDFSDGRLALCWCEMNLTTGFLFDAFVIKRDSMNIPMYYFSGTDDPVLAEFIIATKTSMLADMHMAGKLAVPGFAKAESDLPDALLMAAPPYPRLNTLVIVENQEGGKPTLNMPAHLITQWYNHEAHGADFRKLADEFFEKYGQSDMDVTEGGGTANTNGKRGVPCAAMQSVAKKNKVWQRLHLSSVNGSGGGMIHQGGPQPAAG